LVHRYLCQTQTECAVVVPGIAWLRDWQALQVIDYEIPGITFIPLRTSRSGVRISPCAPPYQSHISLHVGARGTRVASKPPNAQHHHRANGSRLVASLDLAMPLSGLWGLGVGLCRPNSLRIAQSVQQVRAMVNRNPFRNLLCFPISVQNLELMQHI
jgi:hypothetical protein